MTGDIRWARRVQRNLAYAPPAHATPPRLRLNANEGPRPPAALARWLVEQSADDLAELARRYARTDTLERDLAARLDVDPAHVLVTAGADDALERACQIVIETGRNAVLTRPTFEMIARYPLRSGGATREVPWADGPFPADAFAEAIDEDTAAAFIVTPNNPTGLTATPADIARIAAACAEAGAVCIADLAYTEFARHDATPDVLRLAADGLPIVLTRTFSKAWGLAGLRVGYAAGRPDLIAAMRAIGHPFAVSAPSLAIAAHALAHFEPDMRRAADRVVAERTRLIAALRAMGFGVPDSESNGVLAVPPGDPDARVHDARDLWDHLARRGIATRLFDRAPGVPPEIAGSVRITCPADDAGLDELLAALAEAPATTTPAPSGAEVA